MSFDNATATTVVRDAQSGEEQRTQGSGELVSPNVAEIGTFDGGGKFKLGNAVYDVDSIQLSRVPSHLTAVAKLLGAPTPGLPSSEVKSSPSEAVNVGQRSGPGESAQRKAPQKAPISPTVWVLYGILALVIAAGGVMGWIAIADSRSSSDTATAGATEDEFLGDGGLGSIGDEGIRLVGTMASETATARDGLECRGSGPTYPGIDVTVSNGVGRTIGSGVTRSIYDYEVDGFDNMTPQDVRLQDDATEFLINGEGCVVVFEVWVEPSETYNVRISWGNQGEFTYTQTELEAVDWYLSFRERTDG